MSSSGDVDTCSTSSTRPRPDIGSLRQANKSTSTCQQTVWTCLDMIYSYLVPNTHHKHGRIWLQWTWLQIVRIHAEDVEPCPFWSCLWRPLERCSSSSRWEQDVVELHDVRWMSQSHNWESVFFLEDSFSSFQFCWTVGLFLRPRRILRGKNGPRSVSPREAKIVTPWSWWVGDHFGMVKLVKYPEKYPENLRNSREIPRRSNPSIPKSDIFWIGPHFKQTASLEVASRRTPSAGAQGWSIAVLRLDLSCRQLGKRNQEEAVTCS